jgi:hypothetical protein
MHNALRITVYIATGILPGPRNSPDTPPKRHAGSHWVASDLGTPLIPHRTPTPYSINICPHAVSRCIRWSWQHCSYDHLRYPEIRCCAIGLKGVSPNSIRVRGTFTFTLRRRVGGRMSKNIRGGLGAGTWTCDCGIILYVYNQHRRTLTSRPKLPSNSCRICSPRKL